MARTDIEKLIEKTGGLKQTSELLGITLRYVQMLVKGRKPGKFLAKLIRMNLD